MFSKHGQITPIGKRVDAINWLSVDLDAQQLIDRLHHGNWKPVAVTDNHAYFPIPHNTQSSWVPVVMIRNWISKFVKLPEKYEYRFCAELIRWAMNHEQTQTPEEMYKDLLSYSPLLPLFSSLWTQIRHYVHAPTTYTITQGDVTTTLPAPKPDFQLVINDVFLIGRTIYSKTRHFISTVSPWFKMLVVHTDPKTSFTEVTFKIGKKEKVHVLLPLIGEAPTMRGLKLQQKTQFFFPRKIATINNWDVASLVDSISIIGMMMEIDSRVTVNLHQRGYLVTLPPGTNVESKQTSYRQMINIGFGERLTVNLAVGSSSVLNVYIKWPLE